MEGFLLLKGDINVLLVNITQEVSKKSFGGCYHVNQGFLLLKWELDVNFSSSYLLCE